MIPSFTKSSKLEAITLCVAGVVCGPVIGMKPATQHAISLRNTGGLAL